MRKTIAGKTLHIAIFLIASDVLFSGAFLYFAGRIHEADARGGIGVVFYAGSWENTVPRLEAAINLARAGSVDSLIMLGGARPAECYNGAIEMAEFARSAGIESIVHGSDSFDSRSNLDELAELIEPSQRNVSLVLVSDCLHLTRLRALRRHRESQVFSYHCSPVEGALSSHWRRTHYEVIAWVALLLPRSWVDAFLERIRGQVDDDLGCKA